MEYYVVLGWRIFGKFTRLRDADEWCDRYERLHPGKLKPEIVLKLRGG